MNGTISLTEAAKKVILHSIQSRGKGLGIRVGVKSSGCNGYSYILEFVDVFDSNSLRFQSRGIDIYSDEKSMLYLSGMEIDYIKEGLQDGFKFINPNASSECGCGESFNVA